MAYCQYHRSPHPPLERTSRFDGESYRAVGSHGSSDAGSAAPPSTSAMSDRPSRMPPIARGAINEVMQAVDPTCSRSGSWPIGFGATFPLKSAAIRGQIRALETTFQVAVVAIKKSGLYSSLWAGCDELRGGAPGAPDLRARIRTMVA